MHPLDEILNDWRRRAADSDYSQTRSMGTAFEELCIAFLTHDSTQSLRFRKVWTFADWARRQDRPAADYGIDLVAEFRDGTGFAAVQCKFLAEGSAVRAREIRNFLAASGSGDFVERVIIDTTGQELSWTLEQQLAEQRSVPVVRIGLHSLRQSPIDWANFLTTRLIGSRPPLHLRPHQETAVGRIVAGLKENGRGKLVMACGTGKTLVALRAAERLAGAGGRVACFVPSLALMSQTI
ncbi:MAG: DEAD/DEAH box helicase family protein, partial [Rhodobacteraceae bacterium]|nr:DEAD/DEAH box helicase family protein [Paracoccaceae bacterium]